jgi:ubiquinone biosynthesis O-methyltransferase
MNGSEHACAIPDLGPTAYAQWRRSEIGAVTEELERTLILELLGDLNGRAVLDIGCGDGTFAIELAKRGAVVVGIDSSPTMIDAARMLTRQQNADVEFQVASADQLPFSAERFDIVTAITILCFVEDATPVFRGIGRVLRPGGRLVIGELGKWSTWAMARRMRAWLGSRLWQHGYFRTAGGLRSLALQAGLIVQQIRGAIYYPRSRLALRLVRPIDHVLGRMTTFGAAFVALSATKPGRTPP